MNAPAAPKSRSPLLQLSAFGLVVGGLLACNAVLGIGEAELICAESGCDAGVFPPGADPGEEQEPGRVPPERGAPMDAGPQDGSLVPANGTSSSADTSELPAGSNATPPGGGDGVDSDNNGSGSENSGSGDDANTGGAAGGDEDVEPPPPPPPPPSPCQGRAPGEVFCSGTTRISCGSGGSVAQSFTCVSAEHCQQATSTACAVCLASEVRCDGDVLVSCNAARTGFETQRCPSAALCDAATNTCGVAACSAGQSRCRGARLERCNATQTGFDPVTECSSPQACNAAAGACNVCSPGTRRCQDANTIAACDASGTSEAFVGCGVLEGCSGGACVPLGLPLL